MKTLKLDHQLAQDVLAGVKKSTWRLYDDKNLSVNDEVLLIDKVDPNNPSSWQEIGTARIRKVLEKRLGDVTPEDYEGHESYDSVEDLIANFKQHYGAQVDLHTPVKLIYFDFAEAVHESPMTKNVENKSTFLTSVKIYADGGSRGNPGPSASGFVLLAEDGSTIAEKGIYLGITTNNQAEYQALKFALEEAKNLGARNVQVFMDSLLVINQMKGIFKVKNRDLWPIHEAIRQLAQSFERISYTHVPRELNKLADAEVNKALDAHLNS